MRKLGRARGGILPIFFTRSVEEVQIKNWGKSGEKGCLYLRILSTGSNQTSPLSSLAPPSIKVPKTHGRFCPLSHTKTSPPLPPMLLAQLRLCTRLWIRRPITSIPLEYVPFAAMLTWSVGHCLYYVLPHNDNHSINGQMGEPCPSQFWFLDFLF
jgi:hypothetical protein